MKKSEASRAWQPAGTSKNGRLKKNCERLKEMVKTGKLTHDGATDPYQSGIRAEEVKVEIRNKQ